MATGYIKNESQMTNSNDESSTPRQRRQLNSQRVIDTGHDCIGRSNSATMTSTKYNMINTTDQKHLHHCLNFIVN